MTKDFRTPPETNDKTFVSTDTFHQARGTLVMVHDLLENNQVAEALLVLKTSIPSIDGALHVDNL